MPPKIPFMAKRQIQQQLRASALSLGCLLATASASSFANTASTSNLTGFQAERLAQTADERPPEISIETKREILRQASAIASNMNPSQAQRTAWIEIAIAYGDIGEVESARQLLQKVPRGLEPADHSFFIHHYVDRISELAPAYAAIGDVETATALIADAIAIISDSQAIRTTLGRSVHDSFIDALRGEATGELAKAYGSMKQASVAQAGLSTLTDLAKDNIRNEYQRSSALSKIVSAYGQLNEPAIASEGIDQISELAKKTDATWLQSNIAKAYFQIGNQGAAYPWLKAVTLSDSSVYLEDAVKLYGQMNNKQLAEQQLLALLPKAEKIERPSDKVRGLSEVAIAFHTLGNRDKAQQVVNLISLTASTELNPAEFILTLPHLANLYQQLELPLKQQETIDRLYTEFVETEHPTQKVFLFMLLCRLYPQVDNEAAPKYQNALLDYARRALTSADQAEFLGLVAAAVSQRGETEVALQITDEISQIIMTYPAEGNGGLGSGWGFPMMAKVYTDIEDTQLAQQKLQQLTALAQETFGKPNGDIQDFIISAYLKLISEDDKTELHPGLF
ncbi:hypothetical protein [Acaryochloris thomasi]|nr:hypothetical protein [Acaryochloris thomasi]